MGICAGTASLLAIRQEPVPPAFEMRELNEAEEAALPQGEGRGAVAVMCVPCHGVLPAIASRKTSLAWAETVEKMRVKGAQGTDGQAEAAVAYLSKFFPAVDVNTATVDELVQIAGFTAEDAAAIVAYRAAGNAFAAFADLKKVPGLDAKRLTAARPRIVYKPK
jgi:competence protein ComEA